MSSPAALATVTATLHHLLSNVAPGATVTTQPPSIARNGGGGDQINIFLYSTHYNAAFRNSPMPGQARNGENAPPPLPLVLKYLITAYGANDDDISGQQLMGLAMSILHDHPLLGRSDIEGITPDSNLHHQIERLRITPDPLSLDDMSKLWTSFQSAEYRLSTGYEVSVVLIESTRANTAPLPVLKRGDQDQGASVTAAPSPTIIGLRFPNQKPSAEFGNVVTILGKHLAGDEFVVRFQHALLDDPIDIQPEADRSQSEVNVKIPTLADDPELGAKWPAGFYTVSLLIQHPNMPAWTSNQVSMPLSPIITSITPTNAPPGDVPLSIECLPRIRTNQQVRLLFGERTISPDSTNTPVDPTMPTTLTFTIENAVARDTPYIVRLRIDGADSIPVVFSEDNPPEFADNQKVTIT